VCYVLDEPTIGLHPRDNIALLDTLAKLRAKGNTLVVVEHDEDTIRRADHVIDLGPGAGTRGGVWSRGYRGRTGAACKFRDRPLPCGPYRHFRSHRRPIDATAPSIRVSGASLHNLKQWTPAFRSVA